MRNLFKKLPLNLRSSLNKNIMKIGDVRKLATIKIFPLLNYKNTQLLIFVTVVFNYFHETNTNRWFFRASQK